MKKNRKQSQSGLINRKKDSKNYPSVPFLTKTMNGLMRILKKEIKVLDLNKKKGRLKKFQ